MTESATLAVAAVAPAAADDALEAMLLAADVALDRTEPPVIRLAASLAILLSRLETLLEIED